MKKRNMLRKLSLALLIAMLGAGLAACEEEGPAEQAGENIDESMEEMGDGVEEMGDNLEQAAEDAQN
ncbi:hypothetical protein RSO68_10455 [Halomonas saccharevitans]|uniref:Uncharacterized protein n=1 Tax=Halomonas saccharevitans TaxID=416872 RepID=A0ABU3NFE7_9GAMM|nr:hypothetical protein [Halomonas saccharevitans]MDT8879897.1 hypothetical protein [Halomonas saccharevitans]